MKTIGVIVHSFTNEYSLQVLSGVTSFFEDKDVKVLIAQVKTPHFKRGIHEYHCWSSCELMANKELDALIVISGSIASEISLEELKNALSPFKNIPIISIAADLHSANCYYTITECKSSYNEIIKHLKEKHGCRRFCFISANPTKSQEAIERFDAYKAALEKNDLAFDEDLVIDAYFTRTSAYNIFKQKYTDKSQINFDAVVAASDLMAHGIILALNELGVNVPEEVKIIGFDDSRCAEEIEPTLSSVDQNIVYQGYKGAELAWEKINGTKVPKKTVLPATPKYRQSCGCIPMDSHERVFMNSTGEIIKKAAQNKANTYIQADFFSSLSEIDQAYNMFDQINPENTLKKLFYIMPFLLDSIQIDGFSLCLYDEPLHVTRDDDFIVPENCRVSFCINQQNNTKFYEPERHFNPKESLLLNEIFPDEKGFYIISPIFSGETNYGFMINRLKTHSYAISCLHLRILTNAIARAYEFSMALSENEKLHHINEELVQNNSELNTRSTTDELTKILNRRGFLEIGQRTIDIAADIQSNGLLFFADMDNLKKINDTYGHKMGDKAIISMSKVLTKAFRTNDIVGRLSGDEFAVVASGMSFAQEERIKAKIEALFEEEVKENKYPFKLSCSLGSVEFNRNHKSIRKLLTIADSRLYVEKRKKHQNDGRK